MADTNINNENSKVEEIEKIEDKPQVELESKSLESNAEEAKVETLAPSKESAKDTANKINEMFGEDILKIDPKITLEKKEDLIVKPPILSTSPSRNYEGFSEDEKKLLEKMSNPSFDYVTKTIRELRTKTLETDKIKERLQAAEANKSVLPESYYQNPESYRLSPEYKTVESYVQTSRAIANHWETQAIRIEKGEDWQDLVENEKGEILLGKVQPASAEARTRVFQWLGEANNQLRGYSGSLEGLRDKFVEKQSSIVKGLKDAEERFFPTMKGDSFEGKDIFDKASVYIESGGITKDNPAFALLAKSVTLNLILRDVVGQLSAAQNTSKSVKEDIKKAGPNGSSFSGGTGQKGDGDKKPRVNLEDYDRI